ncbi:hypothetical protein KBC31_04980 [Candidatus Saccharibacteria bacterium]|nr:hypothetical protein [Candidatus Saccharibacteria bacterium]
MKYLNKLSVQIVMALVIGFLLAGAGTHIGYPCDPKPADAIGCESHEKAVMHPKDLFDNKQNSLVIFSQRFAIYSIVTLSVLGAVSAIQKKKK